MKSENTDNKKSSFKITKIAIITFSVLVISFVSFTAIRYSQFSKISGASALSQEEQTELHELLKNRYPEKYEILKSLPYAYSYPELDVGAESAIIVDSENGNIIYEKNADEIIPPASMTKLFTMFIVDEEVAAGRLSYDQIIPLPPESWACNMPPHSSLMFLGEGQIVTLEEILLGLSICSGNDAAYALAYTISGNMDDFVKLMNETAQRLGLKNTYFVESSGYSELNTTTAREMAAFCRYYLYHHPQSLEKFHSVKEFAYPKEHNIAPGDVLGPQDFSKGFPAHITMTITQYNTNPLLGKMEGCDGLKTGYIDESGYNLALTAKRNDTRFISVTMKGPGKNTREGQAGRIKDGTVLMDYAFYSFESCKIPEITDYCLKVGGSKIKAVNLVPAFSDNALTVPYVLGNSMAENLSQLKVQVNIPDYLRGNIIAGEQYGSIAVYLGEYKLEEIPLVADRSSKKADIITTISDYLIFLKP